MNVSDVKYQGQLKTLRSQVEALKAKLSERDVKVDVDKELLKRSVAGLTKQLKSHLVREKQDQEYVAQVVTSIAALEPLPRAPYIVTKKSKTPMVAVAHVTDWHVGARINPKETEGWGNFDWSVAQDRVLGQFVPRFLQWLDTQRSGYHIDEIALVCTGDFVSGDIHDELRITNEFPLPEQTARAGDLLAAVGKELAAHCDKLRVVEVGGDNHSRLQKKPQAKQKAANSMGHLVYHIANAELARHSNVELVRGEGMKLLFDLNGFPFLGEHGDTVKSWMSIPFYGIEREVAREAKRRMFARGFKYVLMGHWHAPTFAPYSPIIVGGSLTGTDEYDHSCGRTAPPVQTAFLVGKRGAFAFVPFELQ
jgi:hypothetical protein